LQVTVPENVQVGQTFDVVVTAEDASNRVATGFDDTVSLSSSDPTATGTATLGSTLAALPLSYPFVASDHGVHIFQVSLTKQGSDSVQASDMTSTTVMLGSASTTVNPAPTLAQLVVVTPETAAVGVPTRVVVEALDGSGHVLRNFNGTVTLMTSDASPAVTGLPSTYTFVASDHGVHSFQVTFQTPDPSSSMPTTVTATDGSVTDQASLLVYPATTATHFAIFAEGPAVAGSVTEVVVKALNASNQVVTGYDGTVTLGSSDMTATASATSGGTQTALSTFSYPFSATDAGVHTFYVTFGTTGPQTLTVGDGSATGTTDVQVVSQLSHHHGWWGWF